MRFTLRQDEWVLDFLGTAEWYFVYELPKLAGGEGFDQDTPDSILPNPIVDAAGNPVSSDDTEDWNEFVKPDIEDGFARDRQIVADDIENAEKTDDPAEWFYEEEELPENLPEGPMWRVPVPMEHTEQWYSTLNQCRIMMNKVHDLAEDDSRFRLAIFDSEEGLSQEKALLLAQYEFYCVIQNILVENLMN